MNKEEKLSNNLVCIVEENIQENYPFCLFDLPMHFPQILKSLFHGIISKEKKTEILKTVCYLGAKN